MTRDERDFGKLALAAGLAVGLCVFVVFLAAWMTS